MDKSKHIILALVVLLPILHMARCIEQVCELGWRQFETKCYKEFPDKIKAQSAARTLCQATGGGWVSFEPDEESIYMENVIFGYGDNAVVCVKTLTEVCESGWNSTETKCYKLFPNETLCQAAGGDLPFLVMSKMVMIGDSNNKVICAKPPTQVCELGWRKVGSKCYKEFPDKIKAQSAAQTLCQATGGDWVSFEPEEESIYTENVIFGYGDNAVVCVKTPIEVTEPPTRSTTKGASKGEDWYEFLKADFDWLNN